MAGGSKSWCFLEFSYFFYDIYGFKQQTVYCFKLGSEGSNDQGKHQFDKKAIFSKIKKKMCACAIKSSWALGH